MSPSLPPSPTTTAFPTPTAELAAVITQALYAAGLLDTEDRAECEHMLNGTAPSGAQAWQALLEKPFVTAASSQPDAL